MPANNPQVTVRAVKRRRNKGSDAANGMAQVVTLYPAMDQPDKPWYPASFERLDDFLKMVGIEDIGEVILQNPGEILAWCVENNAPVPERWRKLMEKEARTHR